MGNAERAGYQGSKNPILNHIEIMRIQALNEEYSDLHTSINCLKEFMNEPCEKFNCNVSNILKYMDSFAKPPLYMIYAPDLEMIAIQLGVSTQTVRRALVSDHASWSGIVSKLRVRVCNKLIKDKNISFEEAAYFCGFSEKSTFYRWFKGEYGATPSEVRFKANDKKRKSSAIKAAS